MADFAAAHNAALEDLAVQDNAASDSASECEHNDVRIVLAGACDRFSQRCTVCVIGNADRAGDDTSQFFHQIHILPPEVVGIEDLAFAPVDGSGNTRANADALVQRHILFHQKIQCGLRDLAGEYFRFFLCIGREFAHRDDLLAVIYKTDLRLGAADRNTHTDGTRLLADRCQERVTFALDLPVAAAGCQEKAVALSIGYRLSLAADRPFAVQDQNAQERSFTYGSLHPVGKVSVQVELIHCEIIAVCYMRIFAAAPDDRNTACHRQRFLDMQVALLAVLADSSVIIDAVSDIGILLDLSDQDALSDRVERPGLDEQNVAFLDRHRVEHLKKGILLDPAGKFLPCDLSFEPIIKKCAFLRVEDIPHLCFAILAFVLQREPVIGMDLDR